MPTVKLDSEKNRLEKELAKIQKKIKTIETKQRRPIINSIVKNMRAYEITPEEITNIYNRKTKKVKTTVKNPVPPKYRDPKTNATWSGRGKAPRWITDAEKSGTTRDTFLINK